MLAALMGLAFAPPAGAYEEVTVKDGGAISGTVKFKGPVPKLEPIRVNKNRDVCGDSKPSEALVVADDGGVKGAIVMVEGVTRGKRHTGELVLDNVRCHFVPHVSATMAGGHARVKNSDPVLHNTHGFQGRPTVFNLALPNRDQVIDITKRLSKPGIVHVLCDAHPHMFAWMVVHDSPYVAVTGDRGAYRIDGLPTGTYKVTMWHEGFKPKGVDKDGRPAYEEPRTIMREVTVAPTSTVILDFELK